MRERPQKPLSGQKRVERMLERRARQTRSIGYATMIPTMLGVGPLLGYGVGALLERRFGHAPWLSVGCMVLGGIASVRQMILLLRRAKEADDAGGDSPRRSEP